MIYKKADDWGPEQKPQLRNPRKGLPGDPAELTNEGKRYKPSLPSSPRVYEPGRGSYPKADVRDPYEKESFEASGANPGSSQNSSKEAMTKSLTFKVIAG